MARNRAIETHNEVQRNYFERAVKPTMVPSDTPYIRRHVREMIDFAELTPADRILEAGCGMGRYTLSLRARNLNVEGLDLSPVLLSHLREYADDPSIPLHEADVSNPPLDLHGRFDAIIGFFTLHHLHDLEACFRGMRMMLRPGGRIAFLEPNAFNPLYYVQIALSPGMTWAGDRGIVDMRRAKVFRDLRDAGFAEPRVKRFGFFPPLLANRRVGARAESLLERNPIWRPFLPFQLFGAQRTGD